MDIVSRLKLFLSQNGITNSQFADTCGIPRPTLSQLLNGRNKRVSDEIISKIHEAYPALNIMWLMFGDDDMFVPNANMEDFQVQLPLGEEVKKADAPSSAPQATSENAREAIRFEVADDAYSTPQRPAAAADELSAALENIARSVGRSHAVNASKEAGERRIVNIMVFYSDNSFESFTPKK